MSGLWAEAETDALALLERFGLGDKAHDYPDRLSGGQQQRVAIARALAMDPALVLADEPTGNLDTQRSVEIGDLLKDLNARTGLTVVLVTHNLDLARRADRTIVLRDGRIAAA